MSNSDDIVDRLRRDWEGSPGKMFGDMRRAMFEAADEITQLRADLALCQSSFKHVLAEIREAQQERNDD